MRRIAVLILLLATSASLFGFDKISFSAQQVRSSFAEGKEKTVLTGSARIVAGDYEILSDTINILGANQRYIQCDSQVKIHDSKRDLRIWGDSLFYDRELGVLKVRGNAVLEDYQNDMVVQGGLIEHHTSEEISIVQVGVRILKKDISARSESLIYRRKEDKVTLTGLPTVFKNQDVYSASSIDIDLKTEQILMQGKVKGQVLGKQDQPGK